MRLPRNPIHAAAALLIAVALAVPAGAAAPKPGQFSGVHIENFGRVSDTYYRGGEPEGDDFADLAAIGVKTIIDLRDDGDRTDMSGAERAGLKLLRLPMSSTNVPSTTQVEQFLRMVNDPANQPVYVHCVGGRHRTGTLTAVYRMTKDGWTADQAFQEMQKYDFEHGFGHGGQKKFVFRFAADLERARGAKVTRATALGQS